MLKTNLEKNSTKLETKPLIEKFLTAKSIEGLTDYTIYCYGKRLERFNNLFEELPDSIEEIEDFLSNKNWSQGNRETYWRLLKNLYNFLHLRGYIDHNIIKSVPRPKIPNTKARSFTKDEIQLIFDFMKEDQDYDMQTKILLWVLMDTGIRISEALSINENSFDGHGFVNVTGKVGDRILPISSECELAVRNSLPWKWNARGTGSEAIRKLLATIGLTGNRASAHTIRHTFCREYEGDLQILVDIMGWTSPRMLKVYRPYNIKKAKIDHEKNRFTKNFTL